MILFGLVTLVFSIFYKNKASRLFKEYELKTVNLILLNSDARTMNSGDIELFSQNLKNDYEPFTYFDFALEEELDKIIELFKDRKTYDLNIMDCQKKGDVTCELVHK